MVDEHWERRPDGIAVRVLRDRALGGSACRVWLADTRATPGARAEQCLIFDTGDRVRRVWGVPEDWGQMPADRLMALADAASPRSVALWRREAVSQVVDLHAADAR
jgi:hypothetical protein